MAFQCLILTPFWGSDLCFEDDVLPTTVLPTTVMFALLTKSSHIQFQTLPCSAARSGRQLLTAL